MKTTVKVDNKVVCVAATGLKIGTKGKVTDPGQVISLLDKGTARRLRKQLFRLGRTDLARAKRVVSVPV